MTDEAKRKTALVVSSLSSIEYTDFPRPKNLFLVRQLLFLDDVVYRDVSEFDHEKMVTWMRRHPDKVPRTSGADVNDIGELTMRIEREGYDQALFINPSAKLSHTHKSITEMSEIMAKRIDIESFDTGMVSVGELLFAVVAERMFTEGRTMQHVVNTLHAIKANAEFVAVIDDVTYFTEQHHMSKATGFLSSLLDIKPLMRIKDGEIQMIDKIRKTANAFKHFADYVNDKLHQQNAVGICVYTGDEELKGFLEKNLDPKRVKGYIPGTPCFAAHMGPGFVGIAIHNNPEQYLPASFHFKP